MRLRRKLYSKISEYIIDPTIQVRDVIDLYIPENMTTSKEKSKKAKISLVAVKKIIDKGEK